MSAPLTPQTPARSLPARIVGVIASPRATYGEVAHSPRAFGVLVFVMLVTAACAFAFLSSEAGREALLDAQLTRMESFGRPMSPEQVEQMQRFAPMARYFSMASIVVVTPLFAAALTGLGLAIFSLALGGQATFGQLFAVVSHSFVLTALQALFSLPLNFARGSLSSPTSLGIFFPMLDETGFLAALLGSVDLFRIWWLVSLAIGIGVLYRRRTGPIAASLLVVYGVIALAWATMTSAMSGA